MNEKPSRIKNTPLMPPEDTVIQRPMTPLRISHDPAVIGGKPCIGGLRITVGTVVGLITSGSSRERILQAYPQLEAADIDETLASPHHRPD
jgi:uncharacterized protein (DUF433 family)